MRRFPLAHLHYVTPVDLPSPEQHKQRTLSAIRHLSGIGKVLRHVELDLATMADDDYDRARELEEITEGIQSLGDLIAILADAAWIEVEEMFDQRRQ